MSAMFVLIQGKVLEWTRKGLIKKEGFKRCIFEMESSPHTSGRVYVINNEEVAFAEPKQFVRSNEIQKRFLIILKVRTRKVRKVECL